MCPAVDIGTRIEAPQTVKSGSFLPLPEDTKRTSFSRSPEKQIAAKDNLDKLLSNLLKTRMLKQDGKISADLLGKRVDQLKNIFRELKPDHLEDFQNDKFVQENLELFLDLDPKKIDLAIEVSRYVKGLSLREDFEPQFMPALNLAGFTMVETLRDYGFGAMDAGAIRELMGRLKSNDKLAWGTRSLTHHIERYLSDAHPTLSGKDLEQYVITKAAKDIHDRLQLHTQKMSELGQSQGVEIEVLKYVTKSKKAQERGIDVQKWLPRGIQPGNHAREDWRLLPLLGINEDVGERAYQKYEMSTNPSDSAALQTTIMFELMVGGFITESQLSDNKEGYSLHVSTVFPKTIINEESLRDYKDMARALSGAFASDQRIAFGGFMSGGEEVTDKTLAGTLKGVSKKGSDNKNTVPVDMSLLEIRNLDINPKGQYQALLHKEALDFAFRCAWQQKTDINHQQTDMEKFAAVKWQDFKGELHQLLGNYGLTGTELQNKISAKHPGDPSADNWFWQELAAAREQNPQLKTELSRLIRKHTSEIRRHNKENENKLPIQGTKYLLTEPQAKSEKTIYLSKKERDRLGLTLGSSLTIRVGDKAVKVKIDKAWYRGDGKLEDSKSPFMRVSADVFAGLNIPAGYSFLPDYDVVKRELKLGAVDQGKETVVKRVEPRKFLTEPLGLMTDRFYMSKEERDRLGLQIGDEINIRFGHAIKKIKVVETKRKANSQPEEEGWRLSANVMHELGLPNGFSLRSKYDKDKKEFSFGPIVAQFKAIKLGENGEVEITGGNAFFKQAARQAAKLGIFSCVIDPNKQDPSVIAKGLVDAHVLDKSGKLKVVRIPVPDVVYDKETTQRNEVGLELSRKIEHQVVPKDVKEYSIDKMKFARLLQSNGLSEYCPDTIPLKDADSLAIFLQKHDKVILKPRYGQKSVGIVKIERVNGGYNVRYVKGAEESAIPVEKNVTSSTEVYELVKQLGNGRKYIAQERIPLAEYKFTRNGRNYTRTSEMRVTLQRGIDGKLRVTGVLTRLMDPRLNGTEYTKDPETVLKTIFPGKEEQLLSEIGNVGLSTVSLIESSIKKSLGELSVDIGVTSDGKLAVIEANSKAETRNMFEEIGNVDAAYNATGKSLEYALFLTGMN